MSQHPQCIHIGKIPVDREHTRWLFIWSGAALMGVDALITVILPMILERIPHACELWASAGGKCGAALSGFSSFLELKAEEAAAAVSVSEEMMEDEL